MESERENPDVIWGQIQNLNGNGNVRHVKKSGNLEKSKTFSEREKRDRTSQIVIFKNYNNMQTRAGN